MNKIFQKIKILIKFITTDIWRMKLSDLPDKKAFLIKHQRILILTVRGFKNDNCGLRASALTFYTLLSIVPIIAILFGLFKGFGLHKQLEKIILENFQEHQNVMSQVIEFSNKLLDNTQGGIVAGIGLLLLLWSVIKLLNSIENTLNDIWKIQTSRSIARKFSNYLSILFLAPLAFIISSGVTVFIELQLESLIEQFALLGFLSVVVSSLFQLLPYLVIWSLFLLLYIMMPNENVKFKSALVGAVIAGTLFQITQFILVNFQVGVANYNAIYGSFSVFPLFLLWIQLSWIIFLFGAEYSFASQNIGSFEYEADIKNISSNQKRIISLGIANLVIKNFKVGNKPLTPKEIALTLGTPILLVRKIIIEFVNSGLFIRVYMEDESEDSYQPSKDIDHYTIKSVVETLDKFGSNDIPIKKSEEFNVIKDSLLTFSDLIGKSQENKKLKDI